MFQLLYKELNFFIIPVFIYVKSFRKVQTDTKE